MQMRFFKTKKGIIITIAVILILILTVRHILCVNGAFYSPDYKKEDITSAIKKDNLSDDDYMLIYNQTGVSPLAAKEIINDGDSQLLLDLQDLFFKEPDFRKNYIAYPVTAEERNKEQYTPIVPLKKGDILVTFNTQTLDWRHGHLGLVLNDSGTQLLEHMSIGEVSCVTDSLYWGTYPAFIVLRHPDESIAQKAADYAKENLVGIPYDIFAGFLKKDKTGENNPSSHCSHIVWQAYKSQGVDIDRNKGPIVTPRDVSISKELQVVQVFGINPRKYTDRISK